MTPYKAAKLVNERLAKEGFSKTIPPQMMYNYTTARVNAGKKPFIEVTKDGLSEKSFNEWLERYIAKQKLAVSTAS